MYEIKLKLEELPILYHINKWCDENCKNKWTGPRYIRHKEGKGNATIKCSSDAILMDVLVNDVCAFKFASKKDMQAFRKVWLKRI